MNRLFIDGCSLTAGFADERNNWDITTSWPNFIGRSHTNLGYQGKDNHGIYVDTLKYLSEHKFNQVIIYWSYTDRHSFYDGDDPSNDRVVRNVDKRISSKIYKDGHTNLQNMYTHLSICYMYSIQMLCEKKGIDYYFLTAMPYQHYREASKYTNDNQNCEHLLKAISKDRVLNWQDDDLPCYDTVTDNWVHTLPVLFGTLHNCLNWDGVHLTEEGNKLFAEWVMDSINSGKSIPNWSVDRAFNWALNVTDTKGFHGFTMAGYEGAKKYASTVNNYIYEGP